MDTKVVTEELAQRAYDIEDATERGDVSRIITGQREYLDLVYETKHEGDKGRKAFEILDMAVEYLLSPLQGVYPIRGLNMEDFPSLMEASNGKPEVAAGYAVALMGWADDDGIVLNIRRGLEEAEKAFSAMTELNGSERFR